MRAVSIGIRRNNVHAERNVQLENVAGGNDATHFSAFEKVDTTTLDHSDDGECKMSRSLVIFTLEDHPH